MFSVLLTLTRKQEINLWRHQVFLFLYFSQSIFKEIILGRKYKIIYYNLLKRCLRDFYCFTWRQCEEVEVWKLLRLKIFEKTLFKELRSLANWHLKCAVGFGCLRYLKIFKELQHIIVFVSPEWNGHQQDKGPFGTGIKILWGEQLVDPTINSITSVNVP